MKTLQAQPIERPQALGRPCATTCSSGSQLLTTSFGTMKGYPTECVAQPVIPTFVPSNESYALAIQITDLLADNLHQLGITDDGAADLWTATLAGLAIQQVSNEPGGQRWVQPCRSRVRRVPR